MLASSRLLPEDDKIASFATQDRRDLTLLSMIETSRPELCWEAAPPPQYCPADYRKPVGLDVEVGLVISAQDNQDPPCKMHGPAWSVQAEEEVSELACGGNGLPGLIHIPPGSRTRTHQGCPLSSLYPVIYIEIHCSKAWGHQTFRARKKGLWSFLPDNTKHMYFSAIRQEVPQTLLPYTTHYWLGLDIQFSMVQTLAG